MTDRTIMKRIAAGEQAGLEAAIGKYGGYVSAIIRRRGRDFIQPEDVEELCADVFLALWQNASTLHSDRLKQWLGAVARNKAVEQLRRLKQTVSLDDSYLLIDDRLWDTATWILNKHWQLCYNGITLCGTEYDLPLYVYPEVEVPEIDTSASEATSAETQDFRFTLDSIIATRNVLYATVDMEPITDWGARQMEQTRLNALELWMTPYTAAPSGGGSLGCRLLDSTEEVSRYLLFYVTDEADVLQAGDTVGFQVSIQEEGDTAPHAYDLFTAELETIAGATASGEIDVYSPDNLIHYTSMEIGSMSIHLEGMVSQDKIGEADVRLEIALNYRDGTTVIPSEDVWYPDPAPADAQYIRGTTTSGDHDGNLMTTVCFSQFLELEQLESITINGVTIPNPYVIG